MQLWTPLLAKTLLPAFVAMLLVSILLRKLLVDKRRSLRLIPLQVVAVLIVVLEIGKQAVSFSRGYDLYHIPLHFCSLFIIAIPVMAFYQGKHWKIVATVVSSICTAVFLMMMIYPNLIYSDGNVRAFCTDYMSFHTVVFHNLVLFAFVLILALELYTPVPKGESRAVFIFTLCFCVVSASMAQILKTNYNNFYSCNVPPLETLRTNLQVPLGYGVTQLLYVLIVTALDVGFLQLSYVLQKILAKGIQKHKNN